MLRIGDAGAHHPGTEDPDLADLAALDALAATETLVAYVGWNHGVKVVGAGRATMVMYLMPVFTALLGWVLLGEALRTFHWIGGALIFAGLLLAVPLLVCIKLVLAQLDGMHGWARLLE